MLAETIREVVNTTIDVSHPVLDGVAGVRNRITDTAYVTGTAEWAVDPETRCATGSWCSADGVQST
jgi:hypothetical protein